MSAPLCLDTPRRNDFYWEMHQQKIFKVPRLEQKRWYGIFLFFVHGTVPVVITMVNIPVRHDERAPVSARLKRPTDLSQILESSAARIVRNEYNGQSLFIQESVEFLDVRKFGITFADDQIWLLYFHAHKSNVWERDSGINTR